MSKNPSQGEESEVNLAASYRLVGNVLSGIFRSFLALFLFIKRNLVWLIVLVVVGIISGIAFEKVIETDVYTTDVIVKPNLESRNYLYQSVGEIKSALKKADSSFFANLNLNPSDILGFKVEIEPVETPKNQSFKDQMQYLQLLGEFKNTGLVSDIVRSEVLENSKLNHRISFFYVDRAKGKVVSEKLIEHINSNAYYDTIVQTYLVNAKERIEYNKVLITQIDSIVTNYSEKLRTNSSYGEGKLILEQQQQLDIPALISQKRDLIRDIESKRLETESRKNIISIIHYGNDQPLQKKIYTRKMVLFPLLLIFIFLMVHMFKEINRIASELK